MKTFQVTRIQFFDQTRERQVSEFDSETVRAYSANVFLNDEFVIQVSGNDDEAHKATFAPASCCYATTEEAQSRASEQYDIDEIVEQIEASGFENNFYYLNEHADETY